GPPMVVVSILQGVGKGALRHYSTNGGFETAKEFTFTPGQWTTIKMRVKTTTATTSDGELTLSVNGGDFQGLKNIPLFMKDSTDYRPKWGLYRSTTEPLQDDWIEHKDINVRRAQ